MFEQELTQALVRIQRKWQLNPNPANRRIAEAAFQERQELLWALEQGTATFISIQGKG